jgi:Ser/Thr protein kinase RdoA (MazF antagonist)
MLLTTAELEPALPLWDLRGARASLLNHSENQTFAVTSQDGERFCLRVHRPGYHSRAAIESELLWLDAVRRETLVRVPLVVPGTDGGILQSIEASGRTFLAVLFRFVRGAEPTLGGDLVRLFIRLGGYAALLHNHASSWIQPPGFERPTWNAEAILRPDGLWGDWRVAPGVGEGNRPILERLEEALHGRLVRYGGGAKRFGLIHADMRLGNLLVDGADLTLIDFDDSGFGWFTYDFAAALSFHEAHAAAPALRSAWLEGYQRVRPLDAADIDSLETMVMLRRMALLAWTGSHAETRLAQAQSRGFAETTARLARNYLDGALWPGS